MVTFNRNFCYPIYVTENYSSNAIPFLFPIIYLLNYQLIAFRVIELFMANRCAFVSNRSLIILWIYLSSKYDSQTARVIYYYCYEQSSVKWWIIFKACCETSAICSLSINGHDGAYSPNMRTWRTLIRLICHVLECSTTTDARKTVFLQMTLANVDKKRKYKENNDFFY